VQDNEVPVLRWVFVRHTERLQCELSLDDSHLLYELRTRRLGVTASEVRERFFDVSHAFHRQSDLEKGLLDDGWSLETFEKRHVAKHDVAWL
jgi:hypothetical protein